MAVWCRLSVSVLISVQGSRRHSQRQSQRQCQSTPTPKLKPKPPSVNRARWQEQHCSKVSYISRPTVARLPHQAGVSSILQKGKTKRPRRTGKGRANLVHSMRLMGSPLPVMRTPCVVDGQKGRDKEAKAKAKAKPNTWYIVCG